jgi:hypothetical protein
MCSLDSLKFGNVFLFFARVTIGMVLQSEFAVLLLYFVAACGGGQIEVSIYVKWSVLRVVGALGGWRVRYSNYA